MDNRINPTLPPPDEQLRIVIDSDAGGEIDDRYAIALDLRTPERFRIEGFVATFFAQMASRESIQKSFEAILTLLDVAGFYRCMGCCQGGRSCTLYG